MRKNSDETKEKHERESMSAYERKEMKRMYECECVLGDCIKKNIKLQY